MRLLAHLAVAIVWATLGCATSGAPASEPAAPQISQADLPEPVERSPNTGRLRIRSEQSEAEVLVNGVTQGRVSDFTAPRYLELEPGLHRIEIRKTGYAPFRAEVVVAAEILETIPVTLHKMPSLDPASGEQEEDEGYEEGET